MTHRVLACPPQAGLDTQLCNAPLHNFLGELITQLDLLRHPDDKPSIGLLLCKGREELVVEYALRGLSSPVAVAQWETQLTATLPENLRGSLPTVEEIEAELANDDCE